MLSWQHVDPYAPLVCTAGLPYGRKSDRICLRHLAVLLLQLLLALLLLLGLIALLVLPELMLLALAEG